MPKCLGVSDISPLGACCETLEELWMDRSAVHAPGARRCRNAPGSASFDFSPLHIGSYASEEDAARAYDCAAVKLHGPEFKERSTSLARTYASRSVFCKEGTR
jgi:hypothetical protein